MNLEEAIARHRADRKQTFWLAGAQTSAVASGDDQKRHFATRESPFANCDHFRFNVSDSTNRHGPYLIAGWNANGLVLLAVERRRPRNIQFGDLSN